MLRNSVHICDGSSAIVIPTAFQFKRIVQIKFIFICCQLYIGIGFVNNRIGNIVHWIFDESFLNFFQFFAGGFHIIFFWKLDGEFGMF